MLPLGYILDDRYIINKCLGKGGFGITYLGLDRYSNEKFAIKEFFPTQFSSRNTNRVSITPNSSKDEVIYYKYLKKFRDEAELLMELSHPNIVKVEEYFERNNSGYIVMPYIDGMDLDKYLKLRGKLNQDEILQIVNPILDGLEEVHNKGYLHRDIAPDNIYMRSDSIPMLIDFGSARFYMAKNSGALSAILKIGYSPLEQYTDNNIQNTSSDIYSLSAVIYYMITGIKPVDAVTRQSYMYKDGFKSMIDLEREYQGEYTKNFLRAVTKGLNIEQSRRFQDVASFKKSLNSQTPKRIQPIVIIIWILTIILILLILMGLME